MASRDLSDLQSTVVDKARRVIDMCKNEGVDLLVYCTLRSLEEQAKLFRQGRSWNQIKKKMDRLYKKGFTDLAELIESVGPQHGKRKVTNAGPGESWHNFGEAFDAVPMVGGKALWNDVERYKVYGKSVVECGLTWAGNWKTFREYPHAQNRNTGNPLKVLLPLEIREYLNTWNR